MTPNILSLRRVPAIALSASVLCLFVGPLSAERQNAVPEKPDVRTVTHVLNRIAFGPRPGDVERVQAMGLAAYIEEQLHPERLADAALSERLAGFETLGMSSRDLAEQYYLPAQQLRKDQQLKQQKAEAKADKTDPAMMAGDEKAPKPAAALTPEQRQIQQGQQAVVNELMQAKLLRATMSERQLDEVLVDFWFNHFNVFVGKGQVRQYLTEYERDAIRPHVLGKFRDLLGATAHSPAMLFYLDNFQSVTPNAPVVVNEDMMRRMNDPRLRPEQRQQLEQRLREQQARQKRPQRGLNENYARELMELHTLGVDGGYTQKDVIEVARALTGWTIDRPQQGGGFVFQPRAHDMNEKTILGVHFPAGGGQDEGERVLDILARSPVTAHHIAFELCQRFVADEPPAALVDRVAKVFLDTKGDLREVTRAVITSPEFFAPDAYRAKVKTPLEFVVSAARATGATVVNPMPMVQALRTLGMPLYGAQPPTGYSMTADAWVNTGALLNRMNFAVQLVSGGQAQRGAGPNRPGQASRPDRPAQPQRGLGALRPGAMARAPIQVDVRELAPDTSEATQDKLVQMMLAGDVSEATRGTLTRANSPQSLIALTLGSPEFQKR
jgi:uncharacterized protein (DUF1800 family)